MFATRHGPMCRVACLLICLHTELAEAIDGGWTSSGDLSARLLRRESSPGRFWGQDSFVGHGKYSPPTSNSQPPAWEVAYAGSEGGAKNAAAQPEEAEAAALEDESSRPMEHEPLDVPGSSALQERRGADEAAKQLNGHSLGLRADAKTAKLQPQRRSSEKRRLQTDGNAKEKVGEGSPRIPRIRRNPTESDEEIAAEKEVGQEMANIEFESASHDMKEEMANDDAERRDRQQDDAAAQRIAAYQAKAKCSTYECPAGFEPTPGFEKYPCHDLVCGAHDTLWCCQEKAADPSKQPMPGDYKFGEPGSMCHSSAMITSQDECFSVIHVLDPYHIDWETYHGGETSSLFPAHCFVMKTGTGFGKPIYNGDARKTNGVSDLVPVCKNVKLGAHGAQGENGAVGAAGPGGVAGSPGPPGPAGQKGEDGVPPTVVPATYVAGIIALNLICGFLVSCIGKQELGQKIDVLGCLPCFTKIKKQAVDECYWADPNEGVDAWNAAGDIDYGDGYEAAKG
eukprot:TRINITY_DN83189_c0_g1_i1.p1 TRINITY_DN83189_c0_g1~~TRINITY_DN83189_c0_g1_i1.p1  ORF type:complete len:510 (-),score=96.38 TRINITY_DN83189_c0_g1_i1:202-1731(-)